MSKLNEEQQHPNHFQHEPSYDPFLFMSKLNKEQQLALLQEWVDRRAKRQKHKLIKAIVASIVTIIITIVFVKTGILDIKIVFIVAYGIGGVFGVLAVLSGHLALLVYSSFLLLATAITQTILLPWAGW
jgi:hypothetical protein